MTRLFNQKRKKMGEIILKAGLIGTKRKFFHLNLFGCHIYITTHLMRTRQARDKRWLSDEEWHNSEKYKLKSMMYEKMGGYVLAAVSTARSTSFTCTTCFHGTSIRSSRTRSGT